MDVDKCLIRGAVAERFWARSERLFHRPYSQNCGPGRTCDVDDYVASEERKCPQDPLRSSSRSFSDKQVNARAFNSLIHPQLMRMRKHYLSRRFLRLVPDVHEYDTPASRGESDMHRCFSVKGLQSIVTAR